MTDEEKEHLTLRFYRTKLGFQVKQFLPPKSWQRKSDAFTVDTLEDYKKVVARVKVLGNRHFGIKDLLKLQNV